MIEFYYRCEIARVSYASDDEAYFGAPALTLRVNSYPVVTRTAKTVVIMDHGVRRRVYAHARRSWAKSSQAQALESLKLRRKAQVRFLSAQLAQAQRELAYINTLDAASVPSFETTEPHPVNSPCPSQP